MATHGGQTRPYDARPLLVGRERERARLGDLLDAAVAGRGSLVLISGEAGIGKTTLVNELIDEAQQRDCLVLTGGCYDLTITPPYGPWTEAIRGYDPQENQPPVPSWFRNPEALEQIGSQAALFDETHRFLAAVAHHQPLLVVLEDLHWTDFSSLEALRYLARSLSEAPVLLVVTYRDDEITRRHDLYELIPLLVRESRTQRLHIGRLDQLAVGELVSRAYPLEKADTDRLVDYLWHRAEGNPLFVGELLLGLEEEGILVSTPEGWELGELEGIHVPALLRQVLETRLRHLRPATRAALQIAAVIGQEVPLDVWQAVAELEDDELDRVVQDALRARLLEETLGQPEFRFHHALLREALYLSLIVNRRRRRHRQVGEALIASSHPDPDAVAHHFEQADDPRAVEWLFRAGVRAEERYAYRAAADTYQKAQTILERDPGTSVSRGWLLVKIGHLLRYVDREQSMAHLEEAASIATRAADPVLTAYCRMYQGLILMFSGQLGSALDRMADAVRLMDSASLDEKERSREVVDSLLLKREVSRLGALPSVNFLTQTYVVCLSVAGPFHEVIEIGERFVREVAAATDDEFLRNNASVDAYTGLAHAAHALGRPDEAQSWWARAIAAHEAAGHYVMLGVAHAGELERLVTYETEKVAERRRVAQAAVAAAERAGSSWLSGDRSARYQSALLDIIEGRWDEASELARASLTDHSSVAREVRSAILGTLGQEHTELRTLFQNHINETLPDGLATERGGASFKPTIGAQQVAAMVLLNEGKPEEARAWLEEHDRWLEWSGAKLWRSTSELLWTRYYKTIGDLDSAREHADAALACAGDPRQPLALIAAHRLSGELETEIDRHDEAGRHLDAALELAERCEAPYERALTLLALAELAVARADAQEASRLLREAHAICDQLGANHSLHRAAQIERKLSRSASDHPAGLSDREVEVLEQAATGRTNAEIGEALFISPRTVAQHLRSVYNKLGVSSRAAAVARWAELTSG